MEDAVACLVRDAQGVGEGDGYPGPGPGPVDTRGRILVPRAVPVVDGLEVRGRFEVGDEPARDDAELEVIGPGEDLFEDRLADVAAPDPVADELDALIDVFFLARNENAAFFQVVGANLPHDGL